MSKIEVEDLTLPDAPSPASVAIPGVTPSQIETSQGVITGVDKMDELARSQLPFEAKLVLMCEEVRAHTGQDPRGGGHAIVARPRVILQMLIDAEVGPFSTMVRLQRGVVIGNKKIDGSHVGESDIVGWWRDIPIAVRSTVTDDKVRCLPLRKIPASLGVDRQRAGQMRMVAHKGGFQALDDLRDDPQGPPSVISRRQPS